MIVVPNQKRDIGIFYISSSLKLETPEFHQYTFMSPQRSVETVVDLPTKHTHNYKILPPSLHGANES